MVNQTAQNNKITTYKISILIKISKITNTFQWAFTGPGLTAREDLDRNNGTWQHAF